MDARDVLDAAFTLGAETGLAELTLSALATRLGLDESGLLSIVGSREVLIRWMEARAVIELDWQLPTPDGWDPEQWRAFLGEYFGRHRTILAEDELLAALTVMRPTNYAPQTLNFGYPKLEAILDYLTLAGFGLKDAWNLFSAVSIYTQGFVAVERRGQATVAPPEPSRSREAFDPDQVPRIVRLLREEGVSIGRPGDATFDLGLQWIFDGAARTSALPYA